MSRFEYSLASVAKATYKCFCIPNHSIYRFLSENDTLHVQRTITFLHVLALNKYENDEVFPPTMNSLWSCTITELYFRVLIRVQKMFFLILRVISACGVSLCCTQTHFQKIDLLHFLVLEIFMLISHLRFSLLYKVLEKLSTDLITS